MAPKTGPKTEPETTGTEGTDPEGERIRSLDDRFGKIEAEQAEQKGMLEKILDRLPGGDSDPTSAPTSSPTGSDGGKASTGAEDIQGTVRREIAEAKAREQAEAKAKGDADWRASVDEVMEKVKAERAPRDPQTGLRGRLQRLTFGPDDR